MNILLTGANGFLGREFIRLFQETEYNLLATNRNSLDVSNTAEVDRFFANNKVDIVLHTAFVGVKKSAENSLEALITNLDMHRNLCKHASKFKLMFSFGSGASFDREQPIDNICESEITNRHPADFYGLAKNIIARHIAQHNGNIINLRLFGCFGPLEENTRLIKNSITRASHKEDIIISEDKTMDFFYVDDLFRVIRFYIHNHSEELPKDVNMTYEEKYTLLDIGKQIKNLTHSNINVILKKKAQAPPYTGSSTTIASLDLKTTGLERGIREVYEFHRR